MVSVRLKLPSSEGRVARWLVAFMTLGFIALAAAAVAFRRLDAGYSASLLGHAEQVHTRTTRACMHARLHGHDTLQNS